MEKTEFLYIMLNLEFDSFKAYNIDLLGLFISEVQIL